jgi:hypothetical protein
LGNLAEGGIQVLDQLVASVAATQRDVQEPSNEPKRFGR